MILTKSLFDDDEQPQEMDIFQICQTLGCECNTPGWPDSFGNALSKYIKTNNIRPIRTLSLFSGAGGLDIGFHDLGFDIIESVEIESKFADTLKNNSGKGKKFENNKVNCIDIREYSCDHNIDFIIGGPPCQTFSAAGRRASGVSGISDARGVLFREYVRLLVQLKPKGFLFENVYGIIGAQNGSAWEEIKQSFQEVGYTLHYMILDAADFGVPQHRERLIIVGLKDGSFRFPRPTHGPDSRGIPFYNAGCAVCNIKEEENTIGINGRYGHLINDIPPGLNYSFYTSEMGHPNPIFAWRSKFSDFMYKADPDKPVRTIKAQGGQYTGPLHWDNRYFTCAEYKRLQTFPDDYEINGSRLTAIHQIGNSVPPQLARMLALAIRIQVFDTVFPFTLELLYPGATLSFRKKKRELTGFYRKKAADAIKKLSGGSSSKVCEDRTFKASLTNRFKYQEDDHKGAYNVNVTWSEMLIIRVSEDTDKKLFATTIKIMPKSSWDIPAYQIKLIVTSSDWKGITLAWKVLNQELIKNSLKADLVQLNGYYQYPSNLVCELVETTLPHQNIFAPIIKGACVGQNLNSKMLSSIWNINEDEVLDTAIFLRSLAYEIRNNVTNPQMKKDEWLLPYKFPTLLPESVQLNKSLV